MRRITVLLLAVLTIGCVDAELDTLTMTLDDMRHFAAAPAQVDMPEIPDYEPVAYTHGDQRSPFLLPDEVVQEEVTRAFDSALAPDQSRLPGPLESYPLPELELVGTMRMGARHRALVKTPRGKVVPVQEGDYMGNNFGRVKQIEPHNIAVVERVFTPQEGWQERDVSMDLSTNEAAR